MLVSASLLAACAQIQGLDQEQKVACLDDCAPDAAGFVASDGAADAGATDAGAANGGDASAASDAQPVVDTGTPQDATSEDSAITGPSWSLRRAVTLVSDARTALANEPVLVVLPATFDASHVKSGGDDLRFSTSPQHTDDLPYYIESFSPGAASYVWVSVPSVPVGTSTIYLFYGNAAAAPASSFAATFPHAMRTAGGGAGSFVASGDIAVDWFELRAGDTLITPQGAALHLTARRVILSGIVGGNGRGAAGGATPDGHGGGANGGAASNPVDTESSGGGGNAGAGGHGGEHVVGNGGAGGPATGTAAGDDVAVGGGGAAANANAGGAGGGAISVVGWRTTVANVIRADGLQNVGGSTRNGGGGAGGTVLIGGHLLDVSTATLSAVGGAGGDCAASTGSGGGGGGGGRIKLKVHPGGTFAPPATMTVTGGAGGTCAGTTAPGAAGAAGTTSVDNAATIVTGVAASLGGESAL